MGRTEKIQLNVRSAFARDRVHALSKLTGMTASEVIEDALRGYVPPGIPINNGKLVRRGALLVSPSTGKLVSLENANEALERTRKHDIDD